MEMCIEIQEIQGKNIYKWKKKGQLNMKVTYSAEMDYGVGKHIHVLRVPLGMHL